MLETFAVGWGFWAVMTVSFTIVAMLAWSEYRQWVTLRDETWREKDRDHGGL